MLNTIDVYIIDLFYWKLSHLLFNFLFAFWQFSTVCCMVSWSDNKLGKPWAFHRALYRCKFT